MPQAVHRKARTNAPDGFFAAEAARPSVARRGRARGWCPRRRRRRSRPPPPATCSVSVARAGDGELRPRHSAVPSRPLTTSAPSLRLPAGGMVGDSWIGNQPESNEPMSSWGRYFAEQRVRPFVRKAVDAGHLGADDGRWLTPSATASRRAATTTTVLRAIHGDLWSGNVVFTRGGAVLIDPAAHGGHGLTTWPCGPVRLPRSATTSSRPTPGRPDSPRGGAASSRCTSFTPWPRTPRHTAPAYAGLGLVRGRPWRSSSPMRCRNRLCSVLSVRALVGYFLPVPLRVRAG